MSKGFFKTNPYSKRSPYLFGLLGGIICLLAFRFSLDFVFKDPISDFWNGEGMEYSPQPLKYLESILILLTGYLCIPKGVEKLSSLTIQLLFLMIFVPVSSIYALSDQSREWMYLNLLFWFVTSMVVRYPKMQGLKIFHSLTYIRYFMVFSICFVTVLWLAMSGLLTIRFDLTFQDVYDTRDDFYVGSGYQVLLYYLIGWLGKVIVPFLLISGLDSSDRRQKLLWISLSIILSFIILTVVGEKSFVLRLPLICLIAVLVMRPHFFSWLALSFTALVCVTWIWYYINDDLFLIALLTRRMWFVPAVISFCYHDFFQGHPLLLSGTRLNGLFMDYPYNLIPPQLIGYEYFHNIGISANNGIISDAFMNFGFWGILLWGTLLGYFLLLADKFSYHRSRLVSYTLFIVSFANLVDGYFLTVFFTNGLALTYLLVAFSPEKYPRNVHQKEVQAERR